MVCLIAALTVGCSEVDVEQLRLCERLIPALEAPGARIAVTAGASDAAAANAVALDYQSTTPDGVVTFGRISCRFAGSGLSLDRLRLIGVVTSAQGPLSEIQVFLLRQYWLGLYEAQAWPDQSPGSDDALRGLLYALQLAIDALPLGCLYGLLAVGYVLIYAIIGRINLAFGEIAMVGAYSAFLAVTAMALLGIGLLPLVLLGLLVMAAAVGAIHGLVTERLVFRPLRAAPSQAPLIATVGLAIFLQEYLRLSQGSGQRWVQPIYTETHRLTAMADFDVAISTMQLLVILLGFGVWGAVLWLLRRTALGRNIRACADDPEMAALTGVDVERTVALAFSLGAAVAALAGVMVLLRYGGVSFADGLMLGFKALTAAIIGGLGRVEGALMGGLIVAAVETFWAGYLDLGYRDVAVFGLLAVMLIWRPQGLLGHAVYVPALDFRRQLR